MTPLSGFLKLIAITSLAILSNSSFGPAGAVALSTGHGISHIARRHDTISNKNLKDSTVITLHGKRCKVRDPPGQENRPIKEDDTSRDDELDDEEEASGGGDELELVGAGDYGEYNATGTSKMGIAWSDGSESYLQYYKTNNTKIIYTWSPWCIKGAKELGFECAPMLWSVKQLSEWLTLVVGGPDDYAKYAMGFNEPNEYYQANMDPVYAASIWKQYIQPLKKRGYTLVSPACSQKPSGIEWMLSFLRACDGCTIDVIAIHYYGTNAQGLIAHTELYSAAFGKPIWITEAACQDFSGGGQCTSNEVFNFMEEAQRFVNNSPRVQAFFWFGAVHDMVNVNPLNQLMSSSGHPTELGWMFLN